MSEWGYVIAAYALAWTVVLAYTLYVAGRVRRARAVLEAPAPEVGP